MNHVQICILHYIALNFALLYYLTFEKLLHFASMLLLILNFLLVFNFAAISSYILRRVLHFAVSTWKLGHRNGTKLRYVASMLI